MKRTLISALGAVILFAGCSSLTISTDYDKGTDFSQFKTFSWRDSGDIKDSIMAKRIENVLSDALTARGLKRVDSDGDIWLVAHGRLSKQTQVNTYNSGWGYGYGWYGGGMGMTTSTVTEIPVGTLIVDLVDGKKKDMVWRGTASDTLNPQASPEDREKKLREVAQQLFQNYPPAKK
jgi:Domain of unknown function (DUF4136)